MLLASPRLSSFSLYALTDPPFLPCQQELPCGQSPAVGITSSCCCPVPSRCRPVSRPLGGISSLGKCSKITRNAPLRCRRTLCSSGSDNFGLQSKALLVQGLFSTIFMVSCSMFSEHPVQIKHAFTSHVQQESTAVLDATNSIPTFDTPFLLPASCCLVSNTPVCSLQQAPFRSRFGAV